MKAANHKNELERTNDDSVEMDAFEKIRAGARKRSYSASQRKARHASRAAMGTRRAKQKARTFNGVHRRHRKRVRNIHS